jgi:predicted AlkP superfamily pyrophosphatase or phosphodiesterase
MLTHVSCALRVAVLAFLWHYVPPVANASTNHHVILITIDGFAAYLLADPLAPIPTIRKLAAEGAVAEGMRVSNPSVTWPNHTTLVTGVHPEKHSVLFNGVLVRPGPGMAVKVDPQRDKSDLVAVPTLYDQLHQAGNRTAGINWPCTRRASTLDDDFPDVSDQVLYTTPRLRDELVAAGILQNASQPAFQSQSSARKDQIWTAAAAHVIQKRRPNFMLLHMLITDSTQHKYAPQSPAGYTAFALADAQIADVLRAIEAAGIRDRTTLFVTADHGFETALKIVNPNVVFRKAGLLETSATPSVLKARAQIISEGGIAMVYLTDPATLDENRAKVLSLMGGHEGIAEILRPEQFGALHLPDPLKNRQMADLILVAKQGYAFSNDAHGERSVTEVTLAAGNQGHHGYLSTNSKMNAAFVAWGRGIKPGVKLGLIDNIDVAPTMATLLGQKMPGADGKVLQEMLKTE